MAILVVCPGCRKRFQVSDQFAGKTGPCPNCKTPITIPTKDQEVIIHAPEEFGTGGRSKKGTLVLKPVPHADLKFSWKAALGIGGAAAVAALGALGLRYSGLLADPTAYRAVAIQLIALAVVTPPLVVAGYAVLRDDELEPYRGRELYVRAGALAAVYIVLWGVFSRIGPLVIEPEQLWTWLLVLPPLFAIGGLAGLAALDLDFGSGALLYGFYVMVTVVLRAIAGLGWIWDLKGA